MAVPGNETWPLKKQIPFLSYQSKYRQYYLHPRILQSHKANFPFEVHCPVFCAPLGKEVDWLFQKRAHHLF